MRVTDEAETIQRLRHKFRLFRGEWFADTSAGVPYREVVWPKTVSRAAKLSMFRQLLSRDPGVAAVLSLSLSVDAGRVGHLAFSVRHISGKVLSSADFGPLVLQ